MERIATALLVSSFEYDHIYFESLFSRTRWRLLSARSINAAREILSQTIVPVIIVDEQIEPDRWKDLLEEFHRLPYAPRLILTSLLSADEAWADILNLGGYDILKRPFDQQEVLHSVSMAWLSWKQYAERQSARLSSSPAVTPALTSAAKAG